MYGGGGLVAQHIRVWLECSMAPSIFEGKTADAPRFASHRRWQINVCTWLRRTADTTNRCSRTAASEWTVRSAGPEQSAAKTESGFRPDRQSGKFNINRLYFASSWWQLRQYLSIAFAHCHANHRCLRAVGNLLLDLRDVDECVAVVHYGRHNDAPGWANETREQYRVAFTKIMILLIYIKLMFSL